MVHVLPPLPDHDHYCNVQRYLQHKTFFGDVQWPLRAALLRKKQPERQVQTGYRQYRGNLAGRAAGDIGENEIEVENVEVVDNRNVTGSGKLKAKHAEVDYGAHQDQLEQSIKEAVVGHSVSVSKNHLSVFKKMRYLAHCNKIRYNTSTFIGS